MPNSLHITAEGGKDEAFSSRKNTPRVTVSWGETLRDYWLGLQRIKPTEKVTFFRLLATMINAGVSIVKALKILEDQTKNRNMKRIVHEIVAKIESGQSFSMALSNFPKHFSKAQIGMVQAGEASGRLNQTLLQIATDAEKTAAFRSKIKGAMIYPSVIIAIMIVAFVIVMVVVMPKVKELFSNLGGDLPAVTQTLVNLSDFFTRETLGIYNVSWMILWLGLLVVAFIKWKRTTWGANLWTRFVFRLPIFGKLAKKASLAHFCRGLSTMVGSGIPIIKALRITAAGVGNQIYQKRINQIADDVKHGISMAENMKDDPYYFPDMVVGMIGVAEQTAQIDQISRKLADYYEEEVNNAIKGLSSLVEPVIMVIIGAGVAFMVIAVMDPILSASELAV